jgi:hypothetical protein
LLREAELVARFHPGGPCDSLIQDRSDHGLCRIGPRPRKTRFQPLVRLYCTGFPPVGSR